MAAKQIPGFYYDEVKKRYFQLTKDFKPPKNTGKQKCTSKEDEVNSVKSNSGNAHRCRCIPVALQNRSLFGHSARRLRRSKQLSLLRDIRFSESEARYIKNSEEGVEVSSTPMSSCPYSLRASNSGRSLALHLKPRGSVYLNEMLSVYTVSHGGKSPSDVHLKRDMEVNFPGSRISSFAWSPTEERKILLSLVREHLLRPGFFLKSSELAVLNESGLLTIKRYNKNEIECVAWNSYPKDNMLVCTGERSGVVKFKNIHMYGNYVQPFVTKSPPQVLTFANSSPCLFVGCKSGVVYLYDYRSYSPILFKSSQKGPGYCIDCLRVLDDENYIMVSNWNGEIFKIDVRLRKSVQEYKGHVNNHSKLGFQLDACGTHMFAVGSDACVRVWDVSSGRLEHEHVVERGGTSDSMFRLPAVEYSDRWGGDETKAGLLCTYGSKYHMWPLI